MDRVNEDLRKKGLSGEDTQNLNALAPTDRAKITDANLP